MLTLAIPNKNGAQFLEHTLGSLERNRPFVRWWLQDSCSIDNSVEIAARFAGIDDRIVVEPDRSQADGLNRAISQMGGEIIGFLNSDDCLADGAAAAVIETFAAHPEIDIVYGEVEWIDADGRSEGVHCGDISSLSDILDVYNVWWNGRQWVQPEVFWRRSLWEQVGNLNTGLDLAFDYEYWVRSFRHRARVKRIPRVLAQFRKHDAQKSRNALRAANEIRAIVSNELAFCTCLSLKTRLRLRNRLSYDLYRCGDGVFQNAQFWQALLLNPGWLAMPEVRARLVRSRVCRRLF